MKRGARREAAEAGRAGKGAIEPSFAGETEGGQGVTPGGVKLARDQSAGLVMNLQQDQRATREGEPNG
jgi:hypothetical protein